MQLHVSQADPLFRLSVIIPLSARYQRVERAVRSVLTQTDPIGTEVIVISGDASTSALDGLRTEFWDAVHGRQLKLLETETTGDPAKLRNRGAEMSQGSFLAFLEPDDWWKPGRLEWLDPWLKGHDLILATNETLTDSSDWLATFLERNPAILSSAIIRRSLFEEVGRFPEGYHGRIVPSRVPGREDYELWLRCLALLREWGQKDRFALVANHHIETSPPIPAPGTLVLNEGARKRLARLRETVTLLHVARQLPKRYWPKLARRLASAGKGMIRG